jgi:hypothetical protein
VIEPADRTFTVELWEITKPGTLFFKRLGVQPRGAQAWITRTCIRHDEKTLAVVGEEVTEMADAAI